MKKNQECNYKNNEVMVSIIIPVHNGEQYIRKTVRNVLEQKHKNLELILVENFSVDNSFEACEELARTDNRVVLIKSEIRGTSYARKKGVEIARGKYICFMDQDDFYVKRSSVRNMLNAIVEDGSQICQFGYHVRYPMGIKKQCMFTQKKTILDREQLLKKEVKGLFGTSGSCFSSTVWSKIYDANMLKKAIKDMQYELYYAEDACLNLLAFFYKDVKKVSVRKEGYYVWNAGVGFSSSNKSGLILFDEYEVVKMLGMTLASKYGVPTEQLLHTHIESIYLKKVLICQEIQKGVLREEVENLIEKLGQYKFLQIAKEQLLKLDKKQMWEELEFLVGEYSASEYYDWCMHHAGGKSRWKAIWEKIILAK